jgi:hypothetical protein
MQLPLVFFFLFFFFVVIMDGDIEGQYFAEIS